MESSRLGVLTTMNVMSRRGGLSTFICATLVISMMNAATSLTLLSDLQTPSFIIDTQALCRHAGPPIIDNTDGSIFAPSIRCPKKKMLLHPSMVRDGKRNAANGKYSIVDCEFNVSGGQQAIGYFHTSVIRAREDAISGEDDPLRTFLAEIDLDPTLSCGDAQLVLGLNNHHVGGYYWARSAGAGASMEAPGVGFVSGSKNGGLLRWINDEGFIASNSNDGKRSEWVNFLRKDDTVQLVPADGQGSLFQFCSKFRNHHNGDKDDSASSIRVFGISSQGRPMGSEPEVVCEWRTD